MKLKHATAPPAARFAALLLVLAACLGLGGCLSDPEPGGGLAGGHYLTGTDADDTYHYTRYFVVQSGGRWEWVEYGVDGNGTLCQVTREAGTYSVQGDSLRIRPTKSGKSWEKCPIDKAEFAIYAWEPASKDTTVAFGVRNITPTSFEGYALFLGSPGWKTYTLGPDPYGLY